MPAQSPATPISLLWPPESDRREVTHAPRLTGQAPADLDLERTVTALAAPHGYARDIRAILVQLCADPAALRYRQDVLADLVAQPALVERLAALLPRIQALDSFRYSARPGQSPLHEVVWRIGQLETYVEVIQGLSAALDAAGDALRAEGLQRLREMVRAIEADAVFQRLVDELPTMLEQVRSIASITIGVNLDHDLRPVEATLLSINPQKFKGHSPSLFQALFGGEPDEWSGIARLHSARASSGSIRGGSPMLHPLFRDLAQVLKRISNPLARALARYVRINTAFLSDLGAEIAFFLGAVRLVERMRAAGLPVCRPELLPARDRACELTDTYNLNLALRLDANGATLAGQVITNDITFGPDGRIFVLTGPNQGGKTTYTQAVGLVQVLAQAGLYVPCRHARISLVDGIYTHFPVEEQPDAHAGRLGEEAARLNDIFKRATRHSMVLLNESLSSTSPGEGLYLAQDIVRILRRLGARAIFATHFHDLAAACDDLNADTPGDSIVASLVSIAQDGDGSGGVRQTYQIVPGPPRGHSYARQIAARYGISYDQLTDLLRARGLLSNGDGE